MEKNIWLKKRDGKFILSLTQHPELVPLPVAFVTDPKERFDITSSVLKAKREQDQKQEEDVKEQLAKMFPRILATLPTLRFVFEAPREFKMKHTIKIDSFESDDEIWTIGAVSAQDKFELPEELAQHIIDHGFGKLFIALKHKIDKNNLAVPTSIASVLQECPRPSIPPFHGIDLPEFPYEWFHRAACLAKEHGLPLGSVFYSLKNATLDGYDSQSMTEAERMELEKLGSD